MRLWRALMGAIRKQNEALTSQQLLALFEIVEEEWQIAPVGSAKKRLEEVWAFVALASVCRF